MRTKILNELKTSFEPYSLLWEEWTDSNFCSLPKEEIYLINVHVKNNFQVSIEDVIVFYNNIELLLQAIENLKCNYREFQDWVLMRFPRDLFSLADENKLQTFLETPIVELSINEELKTILKKFNQQTLNKLFSSYTDNDFKERNAFKNLVAFQMSLQGNQININP